MPSYRQKYKQYYWTICYKSKKDIEKVFGEKLAEGITLITDKHTVMPPKSKTKIGNSNGERLSDIFIISLEEIVE